jgi:hypothetical protein
MPQDPLERVQAFLSETRVDPLVLLLDLTKLLPESLLDRAIWLAKNASDDLLRAFLLQALAKRLPTRSERVELTKTVTLPQGVEITQVTVAEGKEAKKLIARLSETERYEVFDQLLGTVGRHELMEERFGGQTKSKMVDWTPAPSPADDERTGGAASVDPPDNMGGGASFGADAAFIGPVDDDDGFEAVAPPSQPPPPQPTTSAVPDKTSERSDLVNLGFAHPDAADRTVEPDEPLQTGRSYYFWLNVGRKHKHGLGVAAPLKVEELPEEAVLTVAIFGFENELAITPGRDIGELKIQADGSVKVQRQPVDPKSVPLSTDAEADYLDRFLLFPISVPLTEGSHRVRCNIYCAQVLVQSHVLTAHVKSTPTRVPEAYSPKLDYVLSESLRASHLASLTQEPHLLSLMVNDNGDGKHGFRFFGDDGTERFKDDAQIDGPEIKGFLDEARQAMHRVSWGKVEPWDPDNPVAYRYETNNFDRKKLAWDLAFMARAGWAIFDGFTSHLNTTQEELQALMAKPGLVQIALKLSPRVVVPAAIIYDYNWDANSYDFATTDFELCPTFSAAIDKARDGGPSLEECDCFKGKCAFKAMSEEITSDPNRSLDELPAMVCPSGFWGYRHSLGLPLTLDGTHKDIPPVINFKDELQMVVGVSTDPLFIQRDPHLDRLKLLKNMLKFERNESVKDIVKRLKSSAPHLVYFYCHGGIRANNNRPYLELGIDDRFGPESLSAQKIKWAGPNPLVFINGCHTTSLNPEISLNFVSSFVQQSGAAGVIGTEITIFEPLASKFAEECLARFLGAPPHNESMPIGRAVRGARLELLKQGNPLGLVYIPYAVASLRLQQN